MRVIAGTYRSRPLRSLPGTELRPTSDRLRETLFDVLTAGNPDALKGSIWIDLFAGTGAVGIEAISRGAGMAYFVEQSSSAVKLISHNLASLAIKTGFKVLHQEATKSLRGLERDGILADFVFLDPPYQDEKGYLQSLNALAELKLLNPEALVIAEHHKKFGPGNHGALQCYRKLLKGDAALSFYRRVLGQEIQLPNLT